MILRQCARRNDVSVCATLTRVNVHDTNDAGGTSFNRDCAGLIKLVCKDVFVVGESNDKLNNEFAVSSNDGTSSAPISMLPADAIVLFVKADYILGHFAYAVAT